jgi:hypothetical protein
MAYRIAGRYIASCNCLPICPCPVDSKPTTPDGECRGILIFAVKEGSLDDVDLSDVKVVLYNHFPANLTAGNWKVGIVVDEAASDDQAQALEKIFSGEAGGPFGEFKPLIGEYMGMQRGRVTADEKSGSVSGLGDFQFEPFTGPDGSPTKVASAMFGFAPEYTIGKASGRGDVLGKTVEMAYGESADFEFSTEMAGEIHPRG